MVLLRDKKPLEWTIDQLAERGLGELTSGPDVAPNEVVHVFQREFAIVTHDDTVRFLYSSYATTCLLLTLYHRPQRRGVLVHFDGAGRSFLDDVLAELEYDDEDEPLEAGIIGGFNDEGGYSIQNFEALMEDMQGHEARFELRIVRACASNNRVASAPHPLAVKMGLEDDLQRPRHTSAALDVRTGQILAVTLVEPDVAAVSSENLLRDIRCLTNCNRLSNCYNQDIDCYVIEPWDYRPWNPVLYLTLPRAELALRLSTSPFAEDDNFSARLQKSLYYMQQHLDPFAHGAIRFPRPSTAASS